VSIPRERLFYPSLLEEFSANNNEISGVWIMAERQPAWPRATDSRVRQWRVIVAGGRGWWRGSRVKIISPSTTVAKAATDWNPLALLDPQLLVAPQRPRRAQQRRRAQKPDKDGGG